MYLLKWMLISLIIPLGALAGQWNEHRASVNGYNSRIDSLEKEIQTLIREKKHTESAEKLNPILKSLVDAHGQLKETAEKRNKELKHMRFRHPERGKEFETKYYKVYDVKSLKEYEEELGIDGSLNRLKEKVEKHYGVEPEEKEESLRRVRERKGESEESKRIKLVK